MSCPLTIAPSVSRNLATIGDVDDVERRRFANGSLGAPGEKKNRDTSAVQRTIFDSISQGSISETYKHKRDTSTLLNHSAALENSDGSESSGSTIRLFSTQES
jgi:hypothetical protein